MRGRVTVVNSSLTINGPDPIFEAQLIERPRSSVLRTKCTIMLLDRTTDGTSILISWLRIVIWVEVGWTISQMVAC